MHSAGGGDQCDADNVVDWRHPPSAVRRPSGNGSTGHRGRGRGRGRVAVSVSVSVAVAVAVAVVVVAVAVSCVHLSSRVGSPAVNVHNPVTGGLFVGHDG